MDKKHDEKHDDEKHDEEGDDLAPGHVTVSVLPKGPKKEWYAMLLSQVESVIEGEPDYIANLSNISALLYYAYKDRGVPVNWCGWYLVAHDQWKMLVLGPFQGRIACIRIPFGRGVCGTVCDQLKSQVVKNVHEFPGHIACDSASNSEIVVPVFAPYDVEGFESRLMGVLDIDSTETNTFDDEDRQALEAITAAVAAGSKWPKRVIPAGALEDYKKRQREKPDLNPPPAKKQA